MCTNLKPSGLVDGTYSYVGGTLCSCKPTTAPTHAPTPSPTDEPVVTTVVTTTIAVLGLTVSTFDVDAQVAVIGSLALLYDVSAGQISITNIRAARRLESQTQRRLSGGGVSFDVHVITPISRSAALLDDMSADSAVLTSTISSSLSSIGMSGTYTASTAVQPGPAPAPATTAPPPGAVQRGEQSWQFAETAVIAVAASAATVLVGAVGWWCLKKLRNSGEDESKSKAPNADVRPVDNAQLEQRLETRAPARVASA
jgi:hypothetical protein